MSEKVESRKSNGAEKRLKTSEDEAAVEYLDRLRKGEGESKPSDLPLACKVTVLESENVPKANEAYKMVKVDTGGGKIFRLCLFRELHAEPGDEMLFVNELAALPIEDRWKKPACAQTKEKVYKFGFGIKVRRLNLHIKRNIYIHNCGALYPLDDFASDIQETKQGEDCAALLNIDNALELKARQNMKVAKLNKRELEEPPAPWVAKTRLNEEKTKSLRAKFSRIEEKKRRARSEADARNKPSFGFVDRIRSFYRSDDKMK